MSDALQLSPQANGVFPFELDSLLGPAEERYFGSSYRDVRYGPWSALTFRQDSEIRANVAVEYPKEWSRNGSGEERVPHLSTIDAVALPVMLFEHLIGEFRLSPNTLRVSHVSLRAGSEPWIDLDNVAVALSIQRRPANEGWKMVGAVGNIRTSILLTGATGESVSSPANGQHAAPSTMYGAAFRASVTSSLLASFDPKTRVLVGEHNTSSHWRSNRARGAGVEEAWRPNLTVIDYLVVMGQLTQAVIGLSNGTSRENMGSLWMRTVDVRATRGPTSLPASWTSRTALLRDRAVRKGEPLHDVRIETASSTGVAVSASLAYTNRGLS